MPDSPISMPESPIAELVRLIQLSVAPVFLLTGAATLLNVLGVRIREAAKLHDVRLHDLRHPHGSSAAGAGLSLHRIGALLGHRQPAATARYAHLAEDPVLCVRASGSAPRLQQSESGSEAVHGGLMCERVPSRVTQSLSPLGAPITDRD